MITQEFITYTLGIVALLNVGVAIWNSIKKPQEKSEVNDAVFCERMKNYENSTEKSIQLALNHSHTVESKLDGHIKDNQSFAFETTKSLSKIEALLEQHLKQ
jgi:hypothetical protein